MQKKRFGLSCLGVALAAGVAGCGGGGGSSTPPPAAGIQSGRSVGAIEVGAAFSAAVQSYGQPSRTAATAADGETNLSVLAAWGARGIGAMYTDLDNDRQIDPAEPNYCVFAIKPDAEPAADRSLVSTAMAMVNGDPTFRAYDGLTAAGIGLGSTPAQVHDAYGQPGAWGDMDSYPAMGLLFSYNSENQVGLLAVYAPLPETSSQLRIVPGTSVGRISVGQTYAAVVAARGVPNQFSSFSTSQNAYCIAMWNYQGISATFVDADGDQHPDDTETCYLVFADEPYPGATAEGITQGSTRSAVRAAYGDPDSVSGDYEYYNGLGVAFQYTTNGTVTTIVVFQAARAAGAGLEAHLQAATAALGAR